MSEGRCVPIIFLGLGLAIGAYALLAGAEIAREDQRRADACQRMGGEWVTIRHHEPRRLCIHE